MSLMFLLILLSVSAEKQQPAVQGSAQACQSWSSTWWEHPELACVEAVGASLVCP